MKDNKANLGLLVAALLSIGQASKANEANIEVAAEEFAPIEALAPEHRAALIPQIKLLRESIKIDWNSVVVGINRNGELVLKGKIASKMKIVANPTCWTE